MTTHRSVNHYQYGEDDLPVRLPPARSVPAQFWQPNDKGNYCLADYDELLGVVFQRGDLWGVMVNASKPYGLRPFFSKVLFCDWQSAAEYAERLIDIRQHLEPSDPPATDSRTSTPWRQQGTGANGKPTYGRKAGTVSYSVKCSKSGSWYFTPYGPGIQSQVQGWYPSAEAAMAAADRYGQ